MKRSVALVALLTLVVSWLICVADVAARSGGGGFRSGGRARSEDERSYRTPEADAPDTPVPDDSPPPKKPKKPQSWRSMVRGILTGGLIGSIFFGRRLGGFGLLEVVVLSGLIALAFWGLSRYQTDSEGQYAHAGAYGGGTATATLGSGGPRIASGNEPAAPLPPAPPLDLSATETLSVVEAAGDAFKQVQAAWTARDIGQAGDVLTLEMRAQLERECARLKASGRVNHVERITLRQVSVVGSRQAGGWDCVTVHIMAMLVDYTTNELGLKVLAGNPFDPVPFQERWELIRPTGTTMPWRVNAIQ